MSELSEHLSQEPPDFSIETFVVDSESRAIWAMRKLAAAQHRIDEVKLQAEEEQRKIEDWIVHATTAERRDVTFFENALKHYAIKVREEEDRKTIVLPDGELSSRSVPEKAAVSDKETFFKWCHENGRELWIRVKEEADLPTIKENVSFSGDLVIDNLTGEIIDGLVGIESEVSVTVHVAALE